MLTVFVFCYFLLVVAVLALVFLPSAQVRGAAAARQVSDFVRMLADHLNAGRRGVALGAGRLRTAARRAPRWAGRNAAWIAAAAATLALPPLIALALRDWQDVESGDLGVSRRVNEDVAALLRGEQLMPPVPLPPALFATPEVEAVRPLIREASRQWDQLDDDFRQRLLVVFRLMRERHGYEMVLLEGYRSPERQARLAALGSQVTSAGAYQSYHQYGLAADSAFRRDGKVVISEADPWAMRGYTLFGEVARSAGLVWGGGWRMSDYGHVELRRAGVLGRREGVADATAPVTEGQVQPSAAGEQLRAEGNGSRTHPATRGAAHRV